MDNYATIQGGAISYRSAGYTDDGTTSFINNTADIINSTISSFPTSIQINFDPEALTLRTYNGTDEEEDLIGPIAKRQMDAI